MYSLCDSCVDECSYALNGQTGVSEINATSLAGMQQLRIKLVPMGSISSTVFGEAAIYIPTQNGFSNTPGCKETYTAIAIVECLVFNYTSSRYEQITTSYFPLTALEYGGSFQGNTISNIR